MVSIRGLLGLGARVKFGSKPIDKYAMTCYSGPGSRGCPPADRKKEPRTMIRSGWTTTQIECATTALANLLDARGIGHAPNGCGVGDQGEYLGLSVAEA